MINKTQLDMRRPPEEWSSALYVMVGQVIDYLNQDVQKKFDNYEIRISKLENLVNKLNRDKI